MADIMLSATEADSEAFSLSGTFKMVCLVYGSEQVDLQVRDPDVSATWVGLRQPSGQPYRFDRAGESYDITLTQGFEYRFHADAAGAVIAMERHV